MKQTLTRCNLQASGPCLGSSHGHWHEVNPLRPRIQSPDERAAHHAALNRLQREQDKRLRNALANGARILKAI